MGTEYLTFRGRDVTIAYTAQDESLARDTAAHLQEALRALCECFQVDGELPMIEVTLTPDRPEFDRCVKEVLNVDIERPSHPARVGQPQGNRLVLLSPRAYTSPFSEYTPGGYVRMLFHEMTHIVEEYLSPNVEAIPRWWSEGLGIYLSGQWKHEKRESARVLEGIKERNVPTIADMQGDTAFTSRPVRLSYVWGWTIVTYIDDTYGRESLRKIVKECGNGDVAGCIGMDLRSLEQGWQRWLLGKGERCIAGSQGGAGGLPHMEETT